MFAVIETGGKQIRVAQGDKIKVEKLPQKEGEQVVFDNVLLFVDDKKVNIGQPTVAGMAVKGKVLSQGRADKITVFKFHSKKRYQKKQGHRQSYTEVEITEIGRGTAPKRDINDLKEQAEKTAPKKEVAEKKAPAVKKEAVEKKPTAKKAPAKKLAPKKAE